MQNMTPLFGYKFYTVSLITFRTNFILEMFQVFLDKFHTLTVTTVLGQILCSKLSREKFHIVYVSFISELKLSY